jgi:hypothetical protein
MVALRQKRDPRRIRVVEEVHQDDVAAQFGGAEWLGVEPLGRPAERGHVHTLEHGQLSKRSEARAELF